MRRRSVPNRKGLLVLPVLVVLVALALTGGAAAITDENGVEQEKLVEVTVARSGRARRARRDRRRRGGVRALQRRRHHHDPGRGHRRGDPGARRRGLQRRRDHQRLQRLPGSDGRAPGRYRRVEGGAGGGRNRARPAATSRTAGLRSVVFANAAPEVDHPAGRLLPELRRPLHLGRSVRRRDELLRHRRADARPLVGGGRRRLLDAGEHEPVHRRRPDPGHVPVPPGHDPDRCGRLDDPRAEDGARGDEHGRASPRSRLRSPSSSAATRWASPTRSDSRATSSTTTWIRPRSTTRSRPSRRSTRTSRSSSRCRT